VELSCEKHGKDWRKFAVSDVGCGMLVASTNLDFEDFDSNRRAWDEVYNRLRSNRNKGLGDLGSGNHFLDAVVNYETEHVYFVIHTGSRAESTKVSGLVDNPRKFDEEFANTVSWAVENRLAIGEILKQVYSGIEFEVILDKNHNHFEEIDTGVIIRKGAVKLLPDELTVIPSTMNGDMVLAHGGSSEFLEPLLFSMSHGTGRAKSRSESKEDARNFDFAALRRAIYIPNGISNASLRTENPRCYRDLDACLKLLGDSVIVEERLTTVAYIGQV